MIRRISKHNDLKDIIKSCPSGVIGDIYAIQYYVQGNNVVIEPSFTDQGTYLEVILPSSELELLPNGILMRRAFYKVLDASYPDGYYNLEFEDNMNIWLGDYETEEPVIPDYVTEIELSSTLSSYATQEWVSGQGYLTAETIPSDIATESYVQSALSGFATESWVQSQGYITVGELPSGLATQSWVESQGYATQSWVQSQSYLTMSSIPSNLVTRSWVENQGYLSASDLSGYATESWVSSNFITIHQYESLNQYIGSVQNELYSLSEYVVSEFTAMGFDGVNPFATESYVSSYVQSYVDDQGFAYEDPDNPFATEGWVQEQGYFIEDGEDPVATQSWVESQGYITSTGLSGLATQSWVESQGYLTAVPSGYATESWVENQGYLTSHQDLSSYATMSWVSSQGYLTAVPAGYATESFVTSVLSGYATQSWVTSQISSLGGGGIQFDSTFPLPAVSDYGSEFILYRGESFQSTSGTAFNAIVASQNSKWINLGEQGYVVSDGVATPMYTFDPYVTSAALDGRFYATQSWTESNYLSLSAIWTGSMLAWMSLTSEERSGYTIALITD